MYYKKNVQPKLWKMLFLGDSGVGKSSIHERVIHSSVDLGALAEKYPITGTETELTGTTRDTVSVTAPADAPGWSSWLFSYC